MSTLNRLGQAMTCLCKLRNFRNYSLFGFASGSTGAAGAGAGEFVEESSTTRAFRFPSQYAPKRSAPKKANLISPPKKKMGLPKRPNLRLCIIGQWKRSKLKP